jgi:peptide-methionine (S)-S-oxide reductase
MQQATLGGGCFWCVESVFLAVNGVSDVISAYSGGLSPNPTYRDICTGESGHVEVIQITFDEDIVDFGTLLDIFFTVHNPTTLNRQGADRGTQYRSVIFYHNDEQKQIAEDIMSELSTQFRDPIVTELSPLEIVYKAEEYHQNYFGKNPSDGYCNAVAAPKVDKFKEKFSDLVK